MRPILTASLILLSALAAAAGDEVPLERGRDLLHGPKHAEGVALLRGVIEELKGVDDDATKLSRLARAHFYLEEDARAAAALEEAQALEPSNAEHKYWLGIVWLYSDLEKARDALKAAVRLEPEYGDAWYELGRAYKGLKESKRALDAYLKAATLRPDHASSQYQAGRALGEAGRRGEAISYFEKTVALDPTSVNAFYNLGLFHYLEGRHEKALKSWVAAVALAPDDLQLHTKVLQACYALKRYEEAQKWREKVMGIHKNTKDSDTAKRTDFCFDQFEVDGKRIYACESFKKREDLTYHYVFKVTEDGKTKKQVNLESNKVARELGWPPYVLGCNEGSIHTTYDIHWAEIPPYEELKAAVVKAIRGELKVGSSSDASGREVKVRLHR